MPFESIVERNATDAELVRRIGVIAAGADERGADRPDLGLGEDVGKCKRPLVAVWMMG